MKSIVFSIIIPVYKVEEYLERCVHSALCQTYQNIEVILVDDGSPDHCPEMCDGFAQRDSRVKAIHKPNGGLSDARNVGLKAATGDYILFLDSDDCIERDACERFLSEIERYDLPDVVIGQVRRIEEKEILFINQYPDFGKISGSDFLMYMMRESSFSFMAQSSVYRRCYLLENNSFFEKGILHEDERWTPIVLLNAKTVVNSGYAFYNYYIRRDSITTTKNKRKNAMHLIETVDYLSEKYGSIQKKVLKKLLMDYLVGVYLHAVNIGGLAQEKTCIKRQFVWKHAYSKRNRIKAALFCFSPRVYCWVNAIAKK